MQNAIWKILAALGVVGAGTFVVLQVQHRLPALNQQQKQATVATADPDGDALPADSATTNETFMVASRLNPDDAAKASPSTFFSADDSTPADSAKDATESDSGSPFDLSEPASDAADNASTSPAAVVPAFQFETSEPENAVRGASFQTDGGPASTDESADTPALPSLDAEGGVPLPPASDAARTETAAPPGSPANPDTSILKFFSPEEEAGGAAASPLPAVDEGGVPAPVDLPEPIPATGETKPPAAAPTAEPSTTPADTFPLVVPEPVPDVTQPAPADPFPPATAAPEKPIAPPVATPAPRTSPARDLTQPKTEPTKTEPKNPGGSDPKAPVTSPRSVSPDASGRATLTPQPRDSSERPAAPARSMDREFEPDAPASAPERPSRERTFGPGGAEAPVTPIERLSPDSGRRAPTSSRSGSTTPTPEPEPFDLDSESGFDPAAEGTPQRERRPESTAPAEPEPFEMDDTDLSGGSSDARPLPPLEDLPEPDGRGGQSAVDAAEASRRISEVMRPKLTIRKQAPETATVGVAHEYKILVVNEGDSPAYDVIVEDELNSAANFISARPAADYDRATGVLAWNIPELAPRETREISVRIQPTGEGTLDGMATVRFKAQVRSATLIRSPRMQLDIQGPAEVRVGDEVTLQFRLVNRGTGDATNVLLHSVLPPGLRHPAGGDLEYELDLLRAGESRDVELVAVAAEPGNQIRISAELSADGMAPTVARTDLAIIGSQLTVERLGPDKRYVGRPARFQNVVTNETSFEAVGAVVEERVPDGMEVGSISSGGDFDPSTRIIRWALPRIAPGKQVVVDAELTPETTGRMESVVEVIENAGFRSRAEQNTVVMVEGLHNVTADITPLDKPVAVGERFGFTVTIDNRGTAVARNVRILLQVPQEIKVVAAGTREVPGELLRDNTVRYETVVSIKPGEKRRFQVTLQGQQVIRNAVVQAQLKYDELEKPLIVSEAVTVFDDQF